MVISFLRNEILKSFTFEYELIIIKKLFIMYVQIFLSSSYFRPRSPLISTYIVYSTSISISN